VTEGRVGRAWGFEAGGGAGPWWLPWSWDGGQAAAFAWLDKYTGETKNKDRSGSGKSLLVDQLRLFYKKLAKMDLEPAAPTPCLFWKWFRIFHWHQTQIIFLTLTMAYVQFFLRLS